MTIKRLSELRTAGSFPNLSSWLREKPQVCLFNGLAGSADALLICDLYGAINRPIVVCLENNKRCETLAQECSSLLDSDSIHLFPSRDAIPYNLKSPFGPTTEARLGVLSRLLEGKAGIYLIPGTSLIQKVPAPRALFNTIVRLQIGTETDLETLSRWLQEIGFRRENRVEDLGTFSIRGDIVDIYPYNADGPVRCEFFGDTLESIREFNIFTQKSTGSRTTVEILPMKEFTLSSDSIRDGIDRINTAHGSAPASETALHNLEHQWRDIGDHDGIEWYLHWFEPKTASLFEYLASETVVVWDDLLTPERRLDEAYENYHRHLDRVPDQLKPLVSTPAQLLLEPQIVLDDLELTTRVFVETKLDKPPQCQYQCSFDQQPALAHNVQMLVQDLDRHQQQGMQTLLVSPNQGHAQRLLELVAEPCPNAQVCIGILSAGFVDRENNLLVYTDNQVFRHRPGPVSRNKRKTNAEAVGSFDELSPGDFVVHADHGIARFLGIERTHVGSGHQDCMVLQYEGKARLYVPVGDFRLVQKYIGKDSYAPALSKLGTAQWEKLKSRTRKSLMEMAQELIELYAKRQYLDGIECGPDSVWQKEFEEAFLFDETPDQLRAVSEIKKDMESKKPMDRLVCGDVGFGKTEVAMRAAFKAVMSGYQVALLAPTTILAAQHFATMTERMANFPVRIGVLSRFLKPKEQRETVEAARRGDIEIVVGTHRLLSQDIGFKNLGLLIIDEEQRFGVKHKEKLKHYRSQVDVLSMTATPIPRTLHLSLIGARDLSMISTPPRNRLPIETKVCEYHDELLRQAIENELERGGQVYVVHNRIRNLYLLHEKVEQLVPRARAVVAHGQMDENELELIMKEFVAGRFDVLLATTIIENGLDIPNVNTIIINRADALGLSQLYQLRGRVGRSSEQAYAYLLTPPFKTTDEVSLKRLRALEQYTDLGSGFQIAMRDLEIRGAGNILGTRQHGAIAAVGFEMYCRLLKEAIDELQGDAPAVENDVKVDMESEAYIPTEYVSDAPTRVSLYQQLSAAESVAEIDAITSDITDRFGPLPEEVMSLLILLKIKVLAKKAGIQRVSVDREGHLTLAFDAKSDTSRPVIKKLFTGNTYEYEVVYEQPVKIKTLLHSADPADHPRETAFVLTSVVQSPDQ